jgi:hypothetical protein
MDLIDRWASVFAFAYFGLRHEVHYWVVWVGTEANAVLTAVLMDFSFNCWCLEIPWDNRIRHGPRCVDNHAENLRLEAL